MFDASAVVGVVGRGAKRQVVVGGVARALHQALPVGVRAVVVKRGGQGLDPVAVSVTHLPLPTNHSDSFRDVLYGAISTVGQPGLAGLGFFGV